MANIQSLHLAVLSAIQLIIVSQSIAETTTPSLEQCWKQAKPNAAGVLTSEAPNASDDAKASQEAKDESTQVLQKFAVSSGSGSTLVTTHIATGYAYAFEPKDMNILHTQVYNAIGFDFSASVNGQNQNDTDYQRQELLTRYGGVGNMYVTLAGRNPCNPLFQWGDRLKSLDRIYIRDLRDQYTRDDQLIAFISHGLGIKAIKEHASGTSFTGVGAAYIGLGFDGPLHVFGHPSADATKKKPSNAAGFISFEVYATENFGSSNAFNSMFGIKNARSSFGSWGTTFRAGIGGCFDFAITYASPFSADERKYLPGTTMVTFGYNRPTSTGSTGAGGAATC